MKNSIAEVVLKKLFSRLFQRSRNDTAAVSDTSPQQTGGHGNPSVPFHPVNELEQLLMRAATDQTARVVFHRRLLTDDLLVATPKAPSRTEGRTLQTSEQIQILSVSDPNGQSVPAIFTSQERLTECFGGGAGYIAMNGKALIEILMNDGAVLRVRTQ